LDLIGQVLGRYRVEEQLGRGAMAVVYRAWDLDLERWVAIKVLHESYAREPEFLGRFQREAKLIAGLQHPNLVHIYGVGQTEDERPWFAMSFLEGRPLDRVLVERTRPMAYVEALPILRGVLEGLEHAHQHKIIHRDMKPGNVLLSQEGKPVILDFGIARPLGGERLTQTGESLGTLTYMAPEQFRTRSPDVGPATDVYACGIMLYQMISGEPPYQGGEAIQMGYAHLHERPPTFKEKGVTAPQGLERVLWKALEKTLEDRYGSAREFLQDLEAVGEGRLPQPPLSSFMEGKTEIPPGVPVTWIGPPKLTEEGGSTRGRTLGLILVVASLSVGGTMLVLRGAGRGGGPGPTAVPNFSDPEPTVPASPSTSSELDSTVSVPERMPPFLETTEPLPEVVTEPPASSGMPMPVVTEAPTLLPVPTFPGSSPLSPPELRTLAPTSSSPSRPETLSLPPELTLPPSAVPTPSPESPTSMPPPSPSPESLTQTPRPSLAGKASAPDLLGELTRLLEKVPSERLVEPARACFRDSDSLGRKAAELLLVEASRRSQRGSYLEAVELLRLAHEELRDPSLLRRMAEAYATGNSSQALGLAGSTLREYLRQEVPATLPEQLAGIEELFGRLPEGKQSICRDALLEQARGSVKIGYFIRARGLVEWVLAHGGRGDARAFRLLMGIRSRLKDVKGAAWAARTALDLDLSWKAQLSVVSLPQFQGQLKKRAVREARAKLTLIQLRRALREFNDHEFAHSMSELAKVVKKFPSGRPALSRFYAEAGLRVLRQGRTELVAPLLKGALHLDDSNLLAHKGLGDYYLQVAKDFSKSLFHYQRVLEEGEASP
jgi:serine/threonine-protein kinase